MFERFTYRARGVLLMAQEEARNFQHNYIGTEHILLGLIREHEGIAAMAIESLGISLEAARQQVKEIIGQGHQAPSGGIPLTPRVKKVLELSFRESLERGHDYIGTEHILLGLIRQDEGGAAQVLIKLGAEPNRVRQEVLQILDEYRRREPEPVQVAERVMSSLQAWLDATEARLSVIEQRADTSPDAGDASKHAERVYGGQATIADAQDGKEGASPRTRETALPSDEAAGQEKGTVVHPDMPSLIRQADQLNTGLERLRAVLRRHGIELEDHSA